MNSPKPLPPLGSRVVARFWKLVDVRSADECWPWKARRLRRGYGQFSGPAGRTLKAHRVAYFLARGEDPGDLLVCHSCDNPPCCNPAHLFIGTTKDNAEDAKRKGRYCGASGERHGLVRHPERRPRGTGHGNAILNNERVLEIRRLYAEGLSQRQIAPRFGVDRKTVASVVRGQTWRHVGGPLCADGRVRRIRRGEKNHATKLRADQVREIRAAYAHGGVSYPILAKRYGVSPVTIRFIVIRRTWAHV